jgi:hypothetical protein
MIQNSAISHDELSLSRKGIILSEELAVEIYKCKLNLARAGENSFGEIVKGSSAVIAKCYDVSPKTVRDIWNCITWKYATCHLWSQYKLTDFQPPIPSPEVKEYKFACCWLQIFD